MMQVSTLYAHSLERQLVSRRNQILQNISRTCSVDPQQQQQQQQQQKQQQQQTPTASSAVAAASAVDVQAYVNELFLSEAGIIPPELLREESSPSNQCSTLVANNNNNDSNTNNNLTVQCPSEVKPPTPLPQQQPQPQSVVECDSKEFSDRLCKLPSQCKGGHILGSGSPRRHSSNMSGNLSATRLCQSAGVLNMSSDYSVVNPVNGKKALLGGLDGGKLSAGASGGGQQKGAKKGKGKEKKEAKKLPSNFMYLGTWSTRQNSERLLEQVRSGDVLEFNITFHHHWGIALVNKNKKATLESLELIHLKRESNKDGGQKAVKQTLAEYWTEGVTARINNSRDVHKQPISAADVVSTSLKIVAQPYRMWPNSEQLITHCRYGEGGRSRQLSDAARWGTLSKCVGLWLSLTSSRGNSPSTSPALRRKRTCSVNF